MALLQWMVLMTVVYGVFGVQVYEFQREGVKSNSYLQYDGDFQAQLEAVTLCVRLRFYYLWEVTGFFQLSDSTNGQPVHTMQGEVNLDYIRVTLANLSRFHFLKERLRALTWHHLCVTFGNGVMVSYLDSVEQHRRPGNLSHVIKGDALKLGAWDSQNSFSGQLTQVNLWDRALTAREIKSLAECKNQEEGNVVAWSGPWLAYGDVSVSERSLKHLCMEASETDYIIFNDIAATAAFQVCKGLSGEVPTPERKEEYETLVTYVGEYESASGKVCKSFWVGVTDKEEEGKWIRVSDNKQVRLKWSVSEPDGDDVENCAIADDPLGFADSRCDELRCVVCAVPRRPVWTLLGTCERFQRNTHWVALQDESGKLLFRGYSDYHITQKADKSEWLWKDWHSNKTIASLSNAANDVPIGRQNWTLRTNMCGQNEGESKQLLLTPCESGFFSCDDASCIPLYQRCDLKFDCQDMSDESGCQLVRFPPVYRPDLPPAISSSTINSSEPLPVSLLIIIESADVDTRSMQMHVNLNVSMTWQEARLSFLNLNQDYTLNRVPYETMQKIWVPVVDFTNTKGNHITKTDSEATMVVNMQGKPILGDHTQPEEPSTAYRVEIYSGPENPLSVRRKYSITFMCQFDLKMYPFDQQYCHMELTMLSASSRLLVFDEETTSTMYEGNPQLVEYTVGEVEIDYHNDKAFAVIFVKVQLLRRSGFIIMNVYIPSLCLLVISYLTMYFTPTNFQVRVLASLTSLLVMATLFTQASASLPKTSYFKMVDVWLLSSIFFIFIIITLHIVIDRARELYSHVPEAPKTPTPDKQKPQTEVSRMSTTSNTVNPSPESEKGSVSATSGLSEINETSRNCRGIILCVPQSPLAIEETSSMWAVPLYQQIIVISRVSLLCLLIIFNIIYWIYVLY